MSRIYVQGTPDQIGIIFSFIALRGWTGEGVNTKIN